MAAISHVHLLQLTARETRMPTGITWIPLAGITHPERASYLASSHYQTSDSSLCSLQRMELVVFFSSFTTGLKKKIAAQSSTSPFAEETKRTDCRTRTVHDCPFPEDPGRE